MEYVYGTENEIEVLRTKADAHTDLTGYHSVRIEYPDQTVTDNFRVVRKLRAAEDAEGNCYDWYEIDHHYRIADRTGPVAEAEAQNRADIDYIAMETGVELE